MHTNSQAKVPAVRPPPPGPRVRYNGFRSATNEEVLDCRNEVLSFLRRESHMFDRITFDAQVLGGRATIRGMRIPVSVIVGQIAHGADWDEVLRDFPYLERADIMQALEYAAWLAQEQVQTS